MSRQKAFACYSSSVCLRVLKFPPDFHEAWNNRGIALNNLGRLEEAIASFNQALKFQPDEPNAFYNKACCHALHGNLKQAIENLQQAIHVSPDECQEWAKTDS